MRDFWSPLCPLNRVTVVALLLSQTARFIIMLIKFRGKAKYGLSYQPGILFFFFFCNSTAEPMWIQRWLNKTSGSNRSSPAWIPWQHIAFLLVTKESINMDTRTCVKLKASIWSSNDVSVSKIQSRCPCWPFPDYCAPFCGNISSLGTASRSPSKPSATEKRIEFSQQDVRVPSQLPSSLAPLFQMKLLAWLPEPNLSARNGRISLLPIPAGTCWNFGGGLTNNLKPSDFEVSRRVRIRRQQI